MQYHAIIVKRNVQLLKIFIHIEECKRGTHFARKIFCTILTTLSFSIVTVVAILGRKLFFKFHFKHHTRCNKVYQNIPRVCNYKYTRTTASETILRKKKEAACRGLIPREICKTPVKSDTEWYDIQSTQCSKQNCNNR